jgi:hypothetical protein
MATLDSSGLKIQTQEEILAEFFSKIQAVFGNTVNTDIESVFGQIANIFAELRAVDQQALLAVYNGFNPNSATGVSLDSLAALTGSIRLGASQSVVDGFITFTGPAAVPNGSLFRNDDQLTEWQTINGPYTDTGGPFPELVPAQLQAVNSGPLPALANTNWSPITVIANVSDFTNPADDATLGRLIETDPEFRARRLTEIYSRAKGPLAAISAVVSKVNTTNGRVELVRTYHNPMTNPVDANGIPFKAFNVVVETSPNPPPSGLQQDIFDAILSAMGAGGYAYGTDYTGTATDEEGQVQNIGFDLFSTVDVYMAITIETANMSGGDGPVIPVDPAVMGSLIRDAVVADATARVAVGRDFRALDYFGVITNLQNQGQLSGIDAVTIQVSDVSKLGPYSTNFVPIGIRQKYDLDTAGVRIVIDGNVIYA